MHMVTFFAEFVAFQIKLRSNLIMSVDWYRSERSSHGAFPVSIARFHILDFWMANITSVFHSF